MARSTSVGASTSADTAGSDGGAAAGSGVGAADGSGAAGIGVMGVGAAGSTVPLAVVFDTEAVANSELVVEPELRDRVREIARRFIIVLGGWELFDRAMKEEFLEEDLLSALLAVPSLTRWKDVMDLLWV
ncbi:hypothetical protein R1sor_024758 [Riccia sorocarpa]|uniref:Uncharacterized protein n=1 Tax=Riccia sorocarpa TaxID=122646 RepID=A0ABD3GUE6_9MARC